MPRPRVLVKPRMVPLLIEEEVYEVARAYARSRGMSFAQYVRDLVLRDLTEKGVLRVPAVVEKGEDPPPRAELEGLLEDPVLEAEIRDLERAVERLEGDALELEYRVDSLAGRGYDVGALLRWEDVQNLRDRWQRLKKWYYAVKRQAGPIRVRHIAQRLVRAKEALDRAAEKYLSSRARARVERGVA